MFHLKIPARMIWLTLVVATHRGAEGADWLTAASTYSHDAYGQRVWQHQPVATPSVAAGPPLRTSGYTHVRSSINYGQSADNYHRVEAWGDPVRPYGEWRFPYRPFSTPYPNWGPPYAGANFGPVFGPAGVGLGAGGYGAAHVPGGIDPRQFGPSSPAVPRVPTVAPGRFPAVRPELQFSPRRPAGLPVDQTIDGYHPVYRD